MANKKKKNINPLPLFLALPKRAVGAVASEMDNRISSRKTLGIAFFGLVSAVIVEIINTLALQPEILQEYGVAVTLALTAVLHGVDNWARHNIEAFGGTVSKK